VVVVLGIVRRRHADTLRDVHAIGRAERVGLVLLGLEAVDISVVQHAGMHHHHYDDDINNNNNDNNDNDDDDDDDDDDDSDHHHSYNSGGHHHHDPPTGAASGLAAGRCTCIDGEP